MNHKIYDSNMILNSCAEARCKYIEDRGSNPTVFVMHPSDVKILTDREAPREEIITVYGMAVIRSYQVAPGTMEVLG